jgi:hypothetical protein
MLKCPKTSDKGEGEGRVLTMVLSFICAVKDLPASPGVVLETWRHRDMNSNQ